MTAAPLLDSHGEEDGHRPSDNDAAPAEAPRPPDRYSVARQLYQHHASRPDSLHAAMIRSSEVADQPQELAAIWCANVDWAHIGGTTRQLPYDIMLLSRGDTGVSFYRYADRAPRAVAGGRPTLDQLRIVADALHSEYDDGALKDIDPVILRKFVLNHPVLGRSFGTHRTYEPTKQTYVTRTRQLPAPRTGLVELMAEAELWGMYPAKPELPQEVQVLHCRRLLAYAKRVGINVNHLADASHGLPERTRGILVRAAQEHRQLALPTRARRLGQRVRQALQDPPRRDSPRR